MNTENQELLFCVKPESSKGLIYGTIICVLFFILGVKFIFLGNIGGLFIGLSFIFSAFFVINRVLSKVSFYTNQVVCENLFFGKKTIPYIYFINLYRHEMGFKNGGHIFIIKYKIGGGIQKLTFYCDDLVYEEIKNNINKSRMQFK